MNSASGRRSPLRARTLEYRQAMKDFHTMFPSLESDIIECVLRANSGHVDSTIDQLLQLTQDGMLNNPQNMRSFERVYYTFDDSTDSSGSLSSELRERLSSSDDDHPPKYTPSPHFAPPPSAYTFSTQPVEPFANKRGEAQLKGDHRRFRDWNPPLLGTLPHDFLRIVDIPTHRSEKPNKSSSSHRHMHSNHSSQSQQLRQSSSRKSVSSHSNTKTSPQFDLARHRPLERRRTTGEVNFTLAPAIKNSRSPQARKVMADTRRDRKVTGHRHQSLRLASSQNSSSHHRNTDEQSQYVEDRKVALLLQNEEFLKELRRNEQFLHELNKGNVSRENNQPSVSSPREHFLPISVDPLEQVSSGSLASDKPSPSNESEDKDFKESLKYMSKSAKKSFNEIARRFTAKRKSYKSMNNVIDPIFANCEEDERR